MPGRFLQNLRLAALGATLVAAGCAPTPHVSRAAGSPLNDSPATANAPLCGAQVREVDAIGASLMGPRLASAGICASFTCYDPLTATYLSADGTRRVCR